MNKYSYISIVIAVLVGVLVGSLLVNHTSSTELELLREEHKKELAQQIQNSKDSILTLNKTLTIKDSLLQHDALKIEKLEIKIRIEKNKNIKLREEAKKLNSSEKETWLIERYDSLPILKPDSVTIPDTVAARVIDDLIIKDGLVKEVEAKDSVISTFHHKDSTYIETLAIHEAKHVQQDSIISKQDIQNKNLNKEVKTKDRELRQEKLKKIGLKLIAIGEGVLIVLLII